MKKIAIIISLLFTTSSFIQAASYSFQNTKLPDNKRIELLLQELTLEEKINLLSTNLGVPRLGIPDCGSMEGLHGLALGGPAFNNGKKTVDGKEVPDDRFTTMFPQAYGLGETWDRECIRMVGNQMAEEARYYFNTQKSKRRGLVLYAPNADLARDPRWGRTEESFGEDAYLTSELSVAMTKGIQGDHPKYWKAASLMKHFLANSNEDGRDSSSSNFDNRLFREYYSYPFYKGIVEGGSRAFMASYNAWNGTPMCINPCLKEIARKQWGNNGIICTDGGGLSLLISAHHAFPTRKEGAAAVVKASVGQFLDRYKTDIQAALDEGLVSEQDINEAIKGNLLVALKLGLLDGKDSKNPYLAIGQDSTLTAPFDLPEARELAKEVTAKSIVLLKNQGLLPLDVKHIKKIALIGPYANQIIYDWYSGTASHAVTILEGMKEALKNTGIEVLYAKDNTCGKAELLTKEADVVLVCTGNHPYGTKPDWFFCPVPSDGREAVDRKSLQLPDEDLLHIMDYDIRHGRTYIYQQKPVLYPFGYGLSYSHFSYSDAQVEKKDKNGYLVSVKVKNDGERDGDEVVQVYASFPEAQVEMPKKKLCGFERIAIPSGETKTIKLHINKRDLSYWDETQQCFNNQLGKIELLFGASSEDIREKVTIQ